MLKLYSATARTDRFFEVRRSLLSLIHRLLGWLKGSDPDREIREQRVGPYLVIGNDALAHVTLANDDSIVIFAEDNRMTGFEVEPSAFDRALTRASKSLVDNPYDTRDDRGVLRNNHFTGSFRRYWRDGFESVTIFPIKGGES